MYREKAWLQLHKNAASSTEKSWQQHPTKQLYDHLPLITKTIQVRQTRHAGHCWWSRDELISDILLWTPSHGRAKAGRPARTYIQQFCANTGCKKGSGISVLMVRPDDDDDLLNSFHYELDVTQGQFLSCLKLIWIQFFFS